MPHARNAGVRIHYEVEGEGPPLVLMHGYTSSLARWRDHGYVDALKDAHRLVLIDARGHGESDKPHERAAYAWDLRAADVVAVLDELDIARAHCWGYSMGGVYAYNLAKFAPERCASLIIGGSHPYPVTFEPFRNVDGSDPDAFITALEILLVETFTPEVRAWMLSNDLQALAAAALDRESIEDVLPTMAMPCLVYAGEDDMRYNSVRTSAKRMPNATFVSIPGCNHVEADERGDLIVPHVRRFLVQCAEPAASHDPPAP